MSKEEIEEKAEKFFRKLTAQEQAAFVINCFTSGIVTSLHSDDDDGCLYFEAKTSGNLRSAGYFKWSDPATACFHAVRGLAVLKLSEGRRVRDARSILARIGVRSK